VLVSEVFGQMSVNPLDLQVIFSQMNQVGKQQTLMKESQVLRQDHASELLIKDGEKEAEDVPQNKDVSQGPGKIKDKEEKNRKKSSKEDEQKEKQKKDEKKIESKDTSNDLKDPNTGQKIDILG
jgi:hypothetical protein